MLEYLPVKRSDSMMLLPPAAIQQAYNFKIDAKTHGYDMTFNELQFSKGNRNYTRRNR